MEKNKKEVKIRIAGMGATEILSRSRGEISPL